MVAPKTPSIQIPWARAPVKLPLLDGGHTSIVTEVVRIHLIVDFIQSVTLHSKSRAVLRSTMVGVPSRLLLLSLVGSWDTYVVDDTSPNRDVMCIFHKGKKDRRQELRKLGDALRVYVLCIQHIKLKPFERSKTTVKQEEFLARARPSNYAEEQEVKSVREYYAKNMVSERTRRGVYAKHVNLISRNINVHKRYCRYPVDQWVDIWHKEIRARRELKKKDKM